MESGKSARLSGFRSQARSPLLHHSIVKFRVLALVECQAATRRKRASTNVAMGCNSTMFQLLGKNVWHKASDWSGRTRQDTVRHAEIRQVMLIVTMALVRLCVATGRNW